MNVPGRVSVLGPDGDSPWKRSRRWRRAREESLRTGRAGRRRATIAAGCLLAITVGGPAWAYRPFDFDDADVAQSRTVELEIAPAEFHRAGNQHSWNLPNLGMAFGLGGGFELGVEGVNSVQVRTPEDEPRTTTFESALELKRVLRRGSLQQRNGTSLAAEAGVEFPAREQPHAGMSLALFASSEGKAGVAHLGAEVSRSPESTNEAGVGLILETPDAHGLRAVTQLAVHGARHEQPQRDELVGAIYEAHEGLAFDLGVNFGQGAERHTELRGGVTWQLGPRTTAPVRNWVKDHLRRRAEDRPSTPDL